MNRKQEPPYGCDGELATDDTDDCRIPHILERDDGLITCRGRLLCLMRSLCYEGLFIGMKVRVQVLPF